MSANSKLLERYVELYNEGELDACMELYAEDAVQLMHDGTFEGRSDIHERLARDLTAFPDAKYTVTSFVEQGDSFADEWTFTGTNTGPFRLPDGTEVPATGKRSRSGAWSWWRSATGRSSSTTCTTTSWPHWVSSA
jgi:predicted ester cyclase